MSDEQLRNLSGQWLAGRYQLGAVRGLGALCVVYEAQDDILQRPVAIKVSPLAVADAYREALTASGGLSHPAFLAIYDVIEQDERLFVAQEFIDGRPLADYLADGAPARRGVALALQLARALAYAHQHDLAHGDVTPAAILIDRHAVAHINNVRLPPDWEYFTAISAATAQSGIAASAEETLAALRADERMRDVWATGALLWTLSSRAGEAPQPLSSVASREFREDVPIEARELLARTLNVLHPQRLVAADALALALESLDDTLTRSASDQRIGIPEAVRSYRDAQASGAGYRGAGRQFWGMTPAHGNEWRHASTASDLTDPIGVDPSSTRPVNDFVVARTAKRSASRANYSAAADGREWGDQPLWPGAAPVAEANTSVMRPWAWTLIGVALFVAFFLIGFLVVPRLTLY